MIFRIGLKISFDMDLEPATKEDIESMSELIRNVFDKVSTLERSLYERLETLEAKSLDLK